MSLEERFFNLYRGLDRARGKNKTSSKVDSKGKRASTNQTVREPYTLVAWNKHLSGVEGLGVIPINDDGKCVWGAIDVDIYPLDLIELEKKVRGLNLPLVVLKTKSGGAHLTAYWKDWQPCSEVRSKMAEVSLMLGFGEREFYPKQVKLANSNDIGNWLNMPYYSGETTERYAIIDGKPASVEEFLDYAESLQLDCVDDIEVVLKESEFSDGPPCIQRILEQKAGQGERNTVLFNIGVYAREKYESDWQDKIDQFNHEFVSPPLNHREVGAIVKSLEKKNYAYTCNNVPLCNNCNREACKSREFGIHAFQHIDVGIAIDSISKMNSEPPMWVLSLEGVRTEIETEDLLSQERFKVICVNAINKIPGRMKPLDWDKFIRTKLSQIELIEMPRETRATDRVLDFVPKYFSQTPPARLPTDIAIGRWVDTEEGYLTRGKDFLDYLDRQGVKYDPRKIWAAISSVGVTTHKFRTIDVWLFPKNVYDGSTKNKLSVPPKKDDHEDF